MGVVTVRIREFERGLWLRRGDFYRLLGPGTYQLWGGLWAPRRDQVLIYTTLATRFETPLLDVLAGRADLADELLFVELSDYERAVLWKDGRVAHLLGPGRYAFWRKPARLRVETFDIRAGRVESADVDAIAAAPQANLWLDVIDAPDTADTLLLKNGVVIERLAPGRHVFWKGGAARAVKVIDRREQTLDVAGQEILTADKVTLRVNLLVNYQVADAWKAVASVPDVAQAVYREAQLALRAAIGTRTLDALLADKQAVGTELVEALAARVAAFGVEIRSAGVRDLILPGDVRAILNQVIAAEKQAQANLITRREETAAARSQANTARLLAENPILARFKELELLREVLAGAKATFVLGNGDVTRQIAALIGKEAQGDNA